MRKIKEVLRLKHGHGLSERQIALSCGTSRSAVAEYLRRAQAAGLGWPLPGEMDDAAIEALLFQDKSEPSDVQQKPDFAAMHQELQSRKDVMLQLLWTEYKETYPHGYQYSQFCELYRRWTRSWTWCCDSPNRAGEKLFVDYAGSEGRGHRPPDACLLSIVDDRPTVPNFVKLKHALLPEGHANGECIRQVEALGHSQ